VIYKIYYVCGIGRKSLKYIRQREIAEAFYEVCIEEELENASISKVATRLNINPSLIIHYFNTRGMSWFFP
jgi:AcrR family transcriptional regulator